MQGLSDASRGSLTTNEYGSAVHFSVNRNKIFRINI